MNKYLLMSLGLAVLCLTGCSLTMSDVVRAMEPIVDGAVKLAADSAGASAEKAVSDQFGEQWGGGEITATVSSIILGAWGVAKGAMVLKNSNPNA